MLFILFFTAYRLKITIDGNRGESEKNLERLRISALSVFLAEGSFDSEYFKTTIREQFLSTDRIVLLAIYSSREGIHYLISKNQSYLAQAPEQSGGGAPQYTIRPVYENLFSLRFSPGIRQDLFIDGIFQDLDRAQVYPILREIFYILLVYLLIASVFLLFAATVRAAPGSLTSRMPDRKPQTRRSRTSLPQVPVRDRRSQPQTHFEAGAAAGLFSPSTGLGWSQHLSPRLASELERAAGSDQDLSLIFISSQYDLKELAGSIMNSFPLRDLVFEYDSSTAAVILPDRDLDQSLKEARDFQQRIPSPVSIGASARNGRLVSANRLLVEAARALKQAESTGGGGIVAFRADPDKYRSSVAARSARPSRIRR
ncbi:MAG: hypothetical protein JSV89_04410 [Spirochaetaceae bacterium]|nr:MAG: hypothetical protein JSV89_04410 [Spirochaetaceae bacterium]